MNEGSLVSYKNRPALVRSIADKILIEKSDGSRLKVRPKDVTIIHPGPAERIPDADAVGTDELIEVWELLAGEMTTLRDITELAFGDFTPQTAQASWQFVLGTYYFSGAPGSLAAATRDFVEDQQKQEERRETAARVRGGFLARLRDGATTAEDRGMFGEIESLAIGRVSKSGLMRDAGLAETPEEAHKLLLDSGIWEAKVNPYPERSGLDLSLFSENIPDLDLDGRTDLTEMTCYAIDDEDTTTPDDAISWHNGALWIHVADASALVSAGSELDLSARSKGATLHLPDCLYHMVPEEAIRKLGLGLEERSPALSMRISVDSEGVPRLDEVIRSVVRVERVTYRIIDERLETAPFTDISNSLQSYRDRRENNGAVQIELPEVRVRVDDKGKVQITPLANGGSRVLVQESMVLAGEVVARWAMEQQLPVPYTTQQAGDIGSAPESLSQMWAARKKLRRSEIGMTPGFHMGLGIPFYTQSTSPLRRYQDLLTHQQISAMITGLPPLSTDELTVRLGETLDTVRMVRQAESLSTRHWILAYLMQNPDWEGEAVVVEVNRDGCTCIIPELGTDVRVFPKEAVERDQILRIRVDEVKLPYLDAVYSVV